MIRRQLSPTQRLDLFLRHKGICHCCGVKIENKPWDVDHVIPLAMGGKDTEENWRPAHRSCHGTKTHTTDVPNIAKAKRREMRSFGIKNERKIRAWRKFDGTIVRKEN